jgi:hypothetical protein
MLVSPVIEGLLGARPDALSGRLTLTPHMPARWNACEWRGLHVGHTTLDVRVSTSPDRVIVHLRRTAGGRLSVIVAPALPQGRKATNVTIDEQQVQPRLSDTHGCRHAEVSLEISDEHEVEIHHQGDA